MSSSPYRNRRKCIIIRRKMQLQAKITNHNFFYDVKPRYGSGWASRKHAGFAPAITRRGNSFAFPLPTVASIPSRLPASPSRACALRPRGHTPSAPPTNLWQATNQQSLLGFRLRSPLPSVEEPCPLSLQTVFSTPSLSLFYAMYLRMVPKDTTRRAA